MKTILCFILILSTEISSAQFTAAEQQQQQQTQNLIVGTMVGLVAVGAAVVIIFTSKAHKQAAAEEAKFQACIGKPKSEIYTIYGPPNSIVDDAQGQGGTILEYQSVITSGGGKSAVYTRTHRKLFYLNKENIATSVKEDIQ